MMEWGEIFDLPAWEIFPERQNNDLLMLCNIQA